MHTTLAVTRSRRAFRPLLLLILLAATLGLFGRIQAQPEARLATPPQAAPLADNAPTGGGGLAAALAVDPSDRAAALQFYFDQYSMASPPAHGWTGAVGGCAAGTTNTAFQAAVAQRINYFRAMAGIPAGITLDATMNGKAQAAALIMSANGSLSHAPPANWTCYTALGAQGAESANLALGAYGWNAIDLYMRDSGSSNYFVGHRRWVLYPPTTQMGTGDVPNDSGQWAANALVVLGGTLNNAASVREPEGFVAWPPRGYVPYTVVYPRWSFSYPGANFSTATVTMRNGNGDAVGLTQKPVANGYGLNTLVWEPAAASGGFDGSRPAADLPFDVTVSNVVIGGQPRSFSYRVTIIDTVAAPALALSAASLVENAPAGTLAGTLSVSGLGGAISYTLVAGAGDADNARFSVDGTALRTTGPLDYEQHASYSVRVQASDGSQGGTTSAAFTITVQNANDAPVIPLAALYAALDEPFDATLIASDQDGDALTLSAAGLPAWLTFQDNANGTATLQGTPTSAQQGIVAFTLLARDALGAETTRALTLKVGTLATYLPLVSD